MYIVMPSTYGQLNGALAGALEEGNAKVDRR
jgi:hypothetical protein